ncbi:hypothetical protein JJQ59_37775 (plasmid) [Cupriavidus necator]|uniref:Uncharacterized protein n=1 Tax=Cupriavidus necator TaxID=106590 RepID=A0A367P8R9_CUPNE|nr:hypothetical protein [Cupriavidus necator]QQX89292.1 hypothetical protein JJQ59_37775 [Cupriavidus necator]RCJ03575.1 hypothetical protein DDK22_36610 [Cupriavidus necator]
MKRRLLLAAVLMCSFQTIAGWKDGNGRPVPDSDARKSSGDFGVQLVLTGDAKTFRDTWNRPGTPILPTTKTVQRGESVSTMLLFAGCKPGKDGRCNVDVKYRLISPNGSSDDFGTTPVSRRAAPKPGITELGDSVVTLEFNYEEPAGRYVFVATVTDRVANKTIEVSAQVTAKDKWV